MSPQLLLGTLRCSSRTIRPRSAAPAVASSIMIVEKNDGKRTLFSSSSLACASAPIADEKRKIDIALLTINIGPLRSFSSSSSSSPPASSDNKEGDGGVSGLLKNVSSPWQWWKNRQESKNEEKYKQRVNYMVNKPDWTLNDMAQELDEVLSSWTSKIPGVNNNKEVAMAKQMHKTVTSVMSVVGVDATVEDLDKMTRADKLQAAVKSEQSVEEINIFIHQFSTASMMHRVLRKRKLEGKRIPETPEAMQEIIQTEGKSVLTPTQKEKLKRQALKVMRKSMR
jgi:hypothetical protein